MTMPWKQKVQQRFDRFAHSYADHSDLQKKVAERLMMHVPDDLKPQHILEIGCGDGGLTQHIARTYPDANITAHITAPKINWQVMDGEALQGQKPYDLIISSMTVQWFLGWPAALKHWRQFLSDDGAILIARPGPHTFAEWTQALEKVGCKTGMIPFLPATHPVGEDYIAMPYANTMAFLNTMRRAGTTTARHDYTPLSVAALKRACQICDQINDGSQTWHILYEMITKIDEGVTSQGT